MKKIGNICVGVVLFLSTSVFAGNVQFDASVDRNQVVEGDNITLRLTVTANNASLPDDDPRLPDINGFELMSSFNNRSDSSIWVNGQSSYIQKKIYTYTLSAQKKGSYVIGPAELRVNGQSITTQPIKVTILDAKNAPKGQMQAQKNKPQPFQDGEDEQSPWADDEDDTDPFSLLLRRRMGQLQDQMNRQGGQQGRQGQQGAPVPHRSMPDNNNDAFFIAVEASKTKVYVGEPIMVNWFLYTKGPISGFDSLKHPTLHGFEREDLDQVTRLEFNQEIVNGIPYNKALLIRTVLFPIQAGTFKIDQYKVKATVIDSNSGMSVFGIGRPYTYIKASKEVPIQVMPLPLEGQPKSFSGAVGRFQITANVSTATPKANQPFSLKIKFIGEGNVKKIELPALDLPKSLEVYDTKKDSKFDKSGASYKEFEVLVIPRAVGDVTIPSIETSYFDPSTRKYVVNHTPQFKLKVLQGDGSANPAQDVQMVQGASQPEKVQKDIQFIKTSPGFYIPPKTQFLAWLVAFVGLFGWFSWGLWQVFRGDIMKTKDLAKKRARMKLKEANKKVKAGDYRGVGVECSNAILSSLGELSGHGGASQTLDVLMSQMKHMPDDLKIDLSKFLNECEILSFAPDSLLEGKKDAASLRKVVTEAEKLISRLFGLEVVVKSDQPATSNA